jgi:hypothetical protein
MSTKKDALIKQRKGLIITVLVQFALLPLFTMLNVPYLIHIMYAAFIAGNILFIIKTQGDIFFEESEEKKNSQE